MFTCSESCSRDHTLEAIKTPFLKLSVELVAADQIFVTSQLGEEIFDVSQPIQHFQRYFQEGSSYVPSFPHDVNKAKGTILDPVVKSRPSRCFSSGDEPDGSGQDQKV